MFTLKNKYHEDKSIVTFEVQEKGPLNAFHTCAAYCISPLTAIQVISVQAFFYCILSFFVIISPDSTKTKFIACPSGQKCPKILKTIYWFIW